MKLRVDILKKELKKRGKKLKDIPDILQQRGIVLSINAVKAWTRAKNPTMPERIKTVALCNYFGVEFGYLVDTEGELIPTITKEDRKGLFWIRVLDNASCGKQDIPKLISKNKYVGENKSEGMYAIIAYGNNMLPIIKDKDEIICDYNASLKNGDIVHYKINNENAIKIYYRDKNGDVLLFPLKETSFFKTTKVPSYEACMPHLQIAKVIEIKREAKGLNKEELDKLVLRG